MKTGEGYWRIMADLNPSIPKDADKKAFETALEKVSGSLFQEGKSQGERYFFIPALNRHRGVAHFYLEQFHSGDAQADQTFAEQFGKMMSETYAKILKPVFTEKAPVADEERKLQLAYHTLYFLQVLTLDRGTTSGLLVHDENDAGILGSLPSHVDKKLLTSWLGKLPSVQADLLQHIISALPEAAVPQIDDAVKIKIAQTTRHFYKGHPEALELLARGELIPPTQDNHR